MLKREEGFLGDMAEGAKKQVMIREQWKSLERLMAPQGYLYAGIPNFQRLFGRDSCIAALQLLPLFPFIAKATLKTLARYQGERIERKREEEPGKILHEHYEGGLCHKMRHLVNAPGKKGRIHQFLTWGFPYYGSVDSTAWWLILLKEYVKKTGDQRLFETLQPNVRRALRWIEDGDKDGDSFVEYERKNPSALLHQGWKDGSRIPIDPPVALVEVQGYYYLVYKEFGLEEKAEGLKKNFNEKFWMEEEEYFAFALNGRKEQVREVTSNPGHLLFTGIVPKESAEKVVRRLFADDLWTPYGIRTYSTRGKYFDAFSYHEGSVWPHDNWIIWMGLKKMGYEKEAEKVKDALFSAYEELGHIPELYAVKDGRILPISIACHTQAWSSGALLNMMGNGR